MTARDLQNEAKKRKTTWAIAKGFDTACPVSTFIHKDDLQNPGKVRLKLWVDNTLRQDGQKHRGQIFWFFDF